MISFNNMKYLGEGLYYRVYEIPNERVLKVEKTHWEKLQSWWKWKYYGRFFVHALFPFLLKRGLKRSCIAMRRAPKLLGNPRATHGFDYEQDRVVVLGEYFNTHTIEENKACVQAFIALTYKTWEYGFADIVFNFTLNNGMTKDGTLILHDCNEIIFDKEKFLHCIRSRKWLRQFSFTRLPEGVFKEYVRDVLNNSLTETKVHEYWGNKK